MKMSFLTENVIPGARGRIFCTDASTEEKMNMVKVAIEKVDGVKNVVLVNEVFPKELIVQTTKLVTVKAIGGAVNRIGMHAIPKGLFPMLEK